MAAFDSNFQLFFTVNSTQIAILHSVGLFMPALDSHMLAVYCVGLLSPYTLSAFRLLPTVPHPFPQFWIPHFTFRIPHSAIPHFTNTHLLL